MKVISEKFFPCFQKWQDCLCCCISLKTYW
jgi:hypothetical protein